MGGLVDPRGIEGLQQAFGGGTPHQRVEAARVQIEEGQMHGAGQACVMEDAGVFGMAGRACGVQGTGVEAEFGVHAPREEEFQVLGMLVQVAQGQVDEGHVRMRNVPWR